ncbi:MAG: HNH endonuclease [Labedaea sp.]
MNGYVGHTDPGWWRFLHRRGELTEVNFWRPGGGRRFAALAPGEPFFFRLKSPIGKIGGFGLFARYAALPVWRAWEVFGQANGTESERALLDRLARLARHPVDRATTIGCVAIADCTFFDQDVWLPVPSSFNPQNRSGSKVDLRHDEGRRLWAACLERAANSATAADWVEEASERQRGGRPHIVIPRLGQGSFRLAVMDAYGRCAVTGEHSLPALEAAHIRPYAAGGSHAVPNGLPLRRDLHRLFDLGYVSATPGGSFLVSPKLREEFANGGTYYALAGHRLMPPSDAAAAPAADALAWHSETVFQVG